ESLNAERTSQAIVETGGELYSQLRQWRKNKSSELNVWNFSILSNGALKEICEKQPRTVQQLAMVNGITKDTLEKFGEEIVGVVKQTIFLDKTPENQEKSSLAHRHNLKSKTYTVQEKRETHTMAYMKWTVDDDKKLKSLYAEGKTVAKLSDFFQRNHGA